MEIERVFDNEELVKSFLSKLMTELEQLSEKDRDAMILVFNEWMFNFYETDRISWEMEGSNYIICKGNLATTVIDALKKIDERNRGNNVE
ncbi:MAG: hypothetical protein ACRCX2_29190 [Paraclostridium sp.]